MRWSVFPIAAVLAVLGCAQDRPASGRLPPINRYDTYVHGGSAGAGWAAIGRRLTDRGFREVAVAADEAVSIEDLRNGIYATCAVIDPDHRHPRVMIELRDAVDGSLVAAAGIRDPSGRDDVGGAAAAAMDSILAGYSGFRPVPRTLPRPPRTPWRKDAFLAELAARGSDPVEGLYNLDDGRYAVGVLRVARAGVALPGRDYVGIVLASTDARFAEGECKLALSPSSLRGELLVDIWDRLKVPHATTATQDDGGITGDYQVMGETCPLRLVRIDLGLPAPPPERSEPAVVSGSGFQVNDDGIVVTNNHVVEGARRIDVLVDGVLRPATLVGRDPHNELAAVRVEALKGNGRAVSLAAPGAVSIGRRIFTMGFPAPDALGTSIKYSEGAINSANGPNDQINFFQFDAPVQPGNSGGPVLGEDGRLLGVIVARMNDSLFFRSTGFVAQNINYAIKGAYLRAFLEAQGFALGDGPPPPSGREAVIEEARGLCHLIIVYRGG